MNKKTIVILICMMVSLIFVYYVRSENTPSFLSPIAELLFNKDKKSLKTVVDISMQKASGSYGIVIKNLKTGELYYSQENTSYDAASLYKLWIMATTYKQIQNNTLKENQILSDDVVNINKAFNISSESAELTKGIVTYSVKDALYQMITISHNYAALLLSKQIKLSQVALFLSTNDFTQSSVGIDGSTPKTTAYEMALFLEKLYNGQLANTENSNKMIDLLKKQKLNNKIPKDLPSDTVVAHKTGELGSFTHDAGIVYGENGNYIIVIMSESNDPDIAEIQISKLSKNVYDYFNNQL